MSEFGVPTPGQLEKINALAKRTLDKSEVFTFHTKMIGDALLKDRLLQLHKSLLDVYRNDARTGVAFMLDHSWSGMFARPKAAYSYGRTYDAVLKKSDGVVESENWALFSDTYIVRGKEKDGVSTDAIIADIEDGTLFDVSIGFGFSTATCSICGNNYYKGSECDHYRGREYDGKLCYIIAKPPGYLMELSGVFDGVYPSAGVLSVTGGTENTMFVQLPEEDIKKLSSSVMTYGSYGSGTGRLCTFYKKDDLAQGNMLTVPDLSNLKGGEKKVNEKTKEMLEAFGITYKDDSPELVGVLNQLGEEWDATVQQIKDSTATLVTATLESTAEYMSQQQVADKLGKELPAEKVLTYAKEGEAYMSQLIEDAVKMGVRAQGNDFPAETWKATFAGMSSQSIKDIMATFEKQAKDEIPADRQTQAGAGKEPFSVGNLPDAAFKA